MFFCLGVMILLNALGTTTETVVHQIYVQLLYLTAFILMGIDFISLVIWLAENRTYNEIRLHKRETEKLCWLLEKLIPKDPPREKHFWDKLVE